MKRIFSCLLSLLCLSLNASENKSLNTIVEGNSHFAFDLYHELKGQQGNLFFSPYNISGAFSMAAAGAKGDTAAEMKKVLYYKDDLASISQLNQLLTDFSDDKNSSQLLIGNAMWVQEGFPILSSFQETIQNTYQAIPQIVSFDKNPAEALKSINQWVSSRTNGKINQLMTAQDINANTRLVLTSTIYMKGKWSHLFDKHSTVKAPFYIREKHPIQVEMMNTTSRYPIYIDQNFDMIELCYLNTSSRGPQLAMVVIVPKEVSGLTLLEKEFTFDRWLEWSGLMKNKKVKFSFPKFKIEEQFDLNQTMIELGMITAFNPQADFSGITGQPNLFINKAVHKTFVQVDESGTEAAAATGMSMNVTSVYQPEEPYHLNVDHPFLFLIVDKKSSTILFMGRLLQP